MEQRNSFSLNLSKVSMHLSWATDMRIPLFVISMLLLPVLAWAAEYKLVLPDIKGKKQHNLADYRGKWVIVNYWATWCPPCLDEIPELVEFHEAHSKKDAVVLGVNYEEVDKEYLTTFVEEYFISYPILVGDPGRPPPFGRLYGLPTTYIISPTGTLVESRIGGVTKTSLEAIMVNYEKSGKPK